MISVALCTYNGARYIEEQLHSILNQTTKPTEIVVSDDGSTDGTLDVVSRALEGRRGREDGPKVHILRNAVPLGVTANFEQALAACTGELIALSDQDDVWHPNRLALTAAAFENRPSLVLLNSDARLVDAHGKPSGQTLLATLGVSDRDIGEIHLGRALDILLQRNIVTGATTVLRRELVQRAQPFPSEWVHDEWLAIVAALTGDVDILGEPLVDYRQHGGNQIGASSLDTRGKLGRLRASRTARNARLLARTEALIERAPDLEPQPSPVMLAQLHWKLRHEHMRSSLPAPRFMRLRPVIRAWHAGAYGRFGLGAQDVLRDLVQPV
jgi:glycosyltransferase involved in cell wall biosynthesis